MFNDAYRHQSRVRGTTMKILLVFFVTLIGTAVAEDYDDKWTEAEIRQLFTQAGVDATAPTVRIHSRNT